MPFFFVWSVGPEGNDYAALQPLPLDEKLGKLYSISTHTFFFLFIELFIELYKTSAPRFDRYVAAFDRIAQHPEGNVSD